MKDLFVQAIHDRKKVRITFDSKQEGAQITLNCAPLDFGPSRTAHEKNDRYHFWNYDGDTKPHVMVLNPVQMVSMVLLAERSNRSDVVTWSTIKSPWSARRDWGRHS